MTNHNVIILFLAFTVFYSSSNAEELKQEKPSFIINFDEKSLKELRAHYPIGQNFKLIKGRNGRPAAQFFGVENPSVIQIPNRTELQFTDAMTIDVWGRLDNRRAQDAFGKAADVGGQVLLAKAHEKNGFQLIVGSNKEQLQASLSSFDDTWAQISCNKVKTWPIIPLGDWYRLTYAAARNSGFRFYINQTLVYECQNARPSFAAANQQDLFIGQLKGGWYPYFGTVQDLHFYRVALSDAQIKALKD